MACLKNNDGGHHGYGVIWIFSLETRQHGVGYYKFSKIEEERQEQQNALNKLRTQVHTQNEGRILAVFGLLSVTQTV